MSTPELAVLFVGLKFRLVRGTSGSTRIFLGLASLMTTVIVAVGAMTVVATSLSEHRAEYLVVGLAVLGLLWLIVPIIFGGGEGLLDPIRFAPFPIGPRQLVVGLLAAAFVGLPGLGTAVIAFSALSHAGDLSEAIIIGLGAVTFTVTAVLSGRVSMAAMAGLLRGRRTRELAGGIAAIIGVTIGLAGPLVGEFTDLVTIARLKAAREVLRFLPWGWSAESMGRASTGDTLAAGLFLAVAVGFALVLSLVWVRLLDIQLTTRAEAPVRAQAGRLVPIWMRPFGDTPVVAVWARALRQLRRDPRELLEIAGFLPMMLVLALPSLDALRSGDDRAVLGSATMGLALGVTSLNMLGADGRSFGVDALAAPSMRTVLLGKSLARITIGVPLILLVSVALALVTGGWRFIVPAVAIGLTGLLAMTSVGMFVSTHYPFPLPENPAMGQGIEGCATGMIRLLGLLAALVVAMPAVAATTYVAVFVSAALGAVVGLVGLAYGLLIFAWSAHRSGEWATAKIPEIFQTLSVRD